MAEEVNREASWIKHYWRPAMAWQYMIVCLFDFVLAPLVLMGFSYVTGGGYIPWEPLTLKLSGYYHMAMGAIIGLSAWTRGLEKIKTAENTTVTEEVPVK